MRLFLTDPRKNDYLSILYQKQIKMITEIGMLHFIKIAKYSAYICEDSYYVFIKIENKIYKILKLSINAYLSAPNYEPCNQDKISKIR